MNLKPIRKSAKLFKKAYEKLVLAESNLNWFVEETLKSDLSVDELIQLAEELPKNYRGSRRIYEKIVRLQDDEYENVKNGTIKPLDFL